jgi:hypothetical protein
MLRAEKEKQPLSPSDPKSKEFWSKVKKSMS